MANLINVVEFTKNENSISATTDTDKVVIINLDDFQGFLLLHDKLDFLIDGVDHTGEHVQRAGQITYDEYWDGKHEFILQDLSEYIAVRKISVESTFNGLYECIQGICKAYNHKILN